MFRSTRSLLVWDKPDSPPTDRFVILWNGYKEENGQRSILKRLEKYADEFRSEYLSFIYEFGQVYIRGKRVVEHLKIEPGFSLWWMSLLAEKSPAKSKAPLNCLRMLILNRLIIEIKPPAVELVSGNKRLSIALKQLCVNLDISFKWTKVAKESSPFTVKKLWLKTPHILQATIFFMQYLYLRWPLRKSLDINWFNGENTISFFSYFINLDCKALNDGKFFSNYWRTLPELTRESDIKLNWIHHFMFSKEIPDTQTGISLLKRFNLDTENQDRHNFLDSFISMSVSLRSIILWLQIVIKSASFQSRLDEKMKTHSKGWLWPLLREDWKRSVYGTTAIENILWIQLFDRAMSNLQKQKIGLYLCENQGWERALIHFWKKHGHGRLIGFAHSTIRYWDLRYFDDYANWKDEDYLSQPKPNQIALNGPAAWKIYNGAKQPMDKMVEVEALRYLHLERLKPVSIIENGFLSDLRNPSKILVLGDIQRSTTNFMLKILESASVFLNEDWELILKIHPANPVNVTDYPRIKLHLTNAPLKFLLPQFNVAIASIYTSAALEVYSAGLPVVTCLDDNDFNFSPLRGENGVCFISTAAELKNVLQNFNPKRSKKSEKSFFWTNNDLSRWKTLLGFNEVAITTI